MKRNNNYFRRTAPEDYSRVETERAEYPGYDMDETLNHEDDHADGSPSAQPKPQVVACKKSFISSDTDSPDDVPLDCDEPTSHIRAAPKPKHEMLMGSEFKVNFCTSG